MREIKFRAWDKKENKWLFGYELQNLGGFSLIGETILMGEFGSLPLEKLLNDVVIMQYTGLKDKNGKEVYEGDIVSYNKRLYQVMINFNGYYLQRFKLWRGEFVPAFTYALSLITKPSKDRFGGEVDNAEVIGNIYENSELLNTIKEG